MLSPSAFTKMQEDYCFWRARGKSVAEAELEADLRSGASDHYGWEQDRKFIDRIKEYERLLNRIENNIPEWLENIIVTGIERQT